MISDKLALLEDEIRVLNKASAHLRYSIDRVAGLTGKRDLTPEELERFESLASRFARLADLLIQRVFRLIDEPELVAQGTLLDRIQRAEKRGWIEAGELVRIRELRNPIAHEYAEDKLRALDLAVLALAPALVELTPKVAGYAADLIRRRKGLESR